VAAPTLDPDAPISERRIREPKMLADEVYEILRNALISGRIQPGERLNLDQLARELHVSNTPVRQALARLEADRLVTRQHNRGFAASALLDRKAIMMSYEFRLLIEPPTAARAAGRRADGHIERLRQICDLGQARDLATGPDTVEELLAERDIAFHTAVAVAAGNTTVVEHLGTELRRNCVYLPTYLHADPDENTWSEHARVMEAVIAGDKQAAAAAMRTHLLNGMRRLTRATSPASTEPISTGTATSVTSGRQGSNE
jgi:DNA-binding GntR family transcriptional regulator